MPANCSSCAKWTTRIETLYGDGSVIVKTEWPAGFGGCSELGIDTASDFCCSKHTPGEGGSTRQSTKHGAPWQHFIMIDCPDCKANGEASSGRCRCAGTGLTRLYDDGYVGDEATRKHPKEIALGHVEPLKCGACGEVAETAWAHCPRCGHKLSPRSETEVVADPLGMAGAR